MMPAASQVPLDDRDARAHQGRADRGNEPRRAGTNHKQVVPARRIRIDPIGRVCIFDERAIVVIVGQNQRLRTRRRADNHG